MLVTKDNIQNYIPQRAPFVMIDTLKSANEQGFETTFVIEDDNLFINDSLLSESALVENIAQTCAAGFGYLNSLQEDSEPQLGFIGAVSKLSNLKSAKTGDCIETQVTILNTFDSIHLIEGVAQCNGETLLSCQMKIVIA